MSNIFHNTPIEQLIYECDDLKSQENDIKNRLKQIREEIDRRGVTEGRGKTRYMEIKNEPYDYLDEKKLREDLGEDIWKSYVTKKSKMVMRFKKLIPEMLRAA